jgi:hypothetical protein
VLCCQRVVLGLQAGQLRLGLVQGGLLGGHLSSTLLGTCLVVVQLGGDLVDLLFVGGWRRTQGRWLEEWSRERRWLDQSCRGVHSKPCASFLCCFLSQQRVQQARGV